MKAQITPQEIPRKSDDFLGRRLTLVALATSLIFCAAQSPGANPPVVTIDFDDLPNGTLVDEEYAQQGVHFVSDYAPGQVYRARPQITAYAGAKSNPNVLVNTRSDDELYSSINIPLVLRFDQPITGVGMQLGCVGDCGVTPPTTTVTLLDCQGVVRAQGQAHRIPSSRRRCRCWVRVGRPGPW